MNNGECRDLPKLGIMITQGNLYIYINRRIPHLRTARNPRNPRNPRGHAHGHAVATVAPQGKPRNPCERWTKSIKSRAKYRGFTRTKTRSDNGFRLVLQKCKGVTMVYTWKMRESERIGNSWTQIRGTPRKAGSPNGNKFGIIILVCNQASGSETCWICSLIYLSLLSGMQFQIET